MSPPTIQELAARFSVIPVGLDKRPHTRLLIRAGAFEWVNRSGQRLQKAIWKPFQQRRPSERELAIWVAGAPPAWAIVSGAVSGVITTDFDGERGRRLLESWGLRPHVRTGSGGFHYYVRHPGFRVKTLNSEQSGKLYGARWPGLDIKGEGGYAVVLGRNQKGPYEHLRPFEPDPWEQLPQDLRQFLWAQSADHAASRSHGSQGEPEAASGKPTVEELIRMAVDRLGTGRNNAGTWLACQMRDNGYAVEEARTALRQLRACAPATNTKGEPEEYSDNEIDATVGGIFGTPKRGSWSRGSPTGREFAGRDRQPQGAVGNAHFYRERAGGIIRLKSGKDGSEEVVPLTNFQAHIMANIAEDDGVEVRRSFEIEAGLQGRVSTFVVPANRFTSMEWPIEHLGAAAIIQPNQKEWARVAIQSLSDHIQERRVYTHTGWRRIGDQYLYLHGDGAIGAGGAVPEVDVRLAGALAHYSLLLPKSQQELVESVRVSLGVLEVAPDNISCPVLAAVCRACLKSCDFTVWLGGPTGAFKSELAALAQQHYGAAMNARHLPGNFASTGNALESLAFSAKDTLLVIDDFAPHGGVQDIARYHAAADRILRAAGNNQGRGRLSSDARLREAKPPRGLILATGEDMPRGQSIRGRTFMVEVAPGEVRTDVLTECQVAAATGKYSRTMGAFVQSLAGKYDQWQTALQARVLELRSLATRAHSRTPGIVADLYAGFEKFLEFGISAGAITAREEQALGERCWKALNGVARAQRLQQEASEPTERFLELLRGAILSGQAYVAGLDGGAAAGNGQWGWQVVGSGDRERLVSRGKCIGWLDGANLYLEPTASFGMAQEMGRATGEPLPIGPTTLNKRLKEKGLLATVDLTRGTLTVRRRILGSSIPVLHLLSDALSTRSRHRDETAEDRSANQPDVFEC
ncbi:MAG: bifunctional DNA primase/polymerase [Bryobacteraceae bacterium]